MPTRIDLHTFRGSRFGLADRQVRVFVPRNHHAAAEPHVVLYLQDGQNLFSAATAFAGVPWRAGETAQRLIDHGRIQPLLLVGIDHAGPARTHDYTPVVWHGRGGGAAAYGRMLVEEIKPFIDATYRTRTDRDGTGIGGSSLGGLCALYLALCQPDSWGRVAALSPSLFWGNDALLQAIAALPKRPPVRIWMDVGSREPLQLRQCVRAAAELLAAKGWRRDRVVTRADLAYREVPRADHHESSWAARFGRVLQFLFPAQRPAGRRPRAAVTAR